MIMWKEFEKWEGNEEYEIYGWDDEVERKDKDDGMNIGNRRREGSDEIIIKKKRRKMV